jgi:PBSX family phage terminase large subunit
VIPGVARLSPKQVLSIGQSTARINIWEGSIRSGKTISSLWRWLMFVANAPHDGELVMFGKTRDSVASNLFEPLSNPDIFGEFSRDVEYTAGAPTATIFGRRIRVIGANDAKAEPKVRGGTWTGAYGDELTTLPESFFRQALGRLSTPSAALFGTTNPDNPAHWLRRDFLLDSNLNLRSWHFTIDDNPHLDPHYVASIKAEYKGLWHKRFILGLWVAAEGAVFDMWDEALHVLRGPVPQLMTLPGVGVDYGTTAAFSAHMLGVAAPNHVTGTPARLVLTREYRHDPKVAGRQKTDAEFSADLRAWIGNDRPQWVAVDPSAASFKLQLFRDGLSNVMDAKNDVLDTIRLASSLLATGNLVVHESCKGLIAEVPGYAWDPAAAMKGQDSPIKVDDHSVDSGLRYAVSSTETLWRPFIPRGRVLQAA